MIRYVFGAGKVGLQTIAFLQRIHLMVSAIFDNDEKKWGTEVLGVPVMKFEKHFLTKKDSFVYVACVEYRDIVAQLKKVEIPDERIIITSSIFANDFLNNIAYHIVVAAKKEGLSKKLQRDVLFDLSGGMVLGGVEQWNYELAAKLKEKEINAAYIVIKGDENVLENTIYPSINIEAESDIIYYIKRIMEAQPKVIICNFPFSSMKAACIIKRCYDKNMKIIAIVHNDLDIYYETYSFWEKEIDLCIGISAKIEEKIKDNLKLADKFMRLQWKINIPLVNNHRYSKSNEPIRIGYAGRIVEHQKRLDRIILIAKGLVKKDVNFRIQIAGDGMYRATLEYLILQNDLQKYFEFLGRLNRDQMWEFWDNQDIYINCSDYEGHSIAQTEAMASGAVPVMMDVSGARDDIEDGENGFVVSIGDVKSMVDKIEWLYHNRHQLLNMGFRSMRKIEANNKLADHDLKLLLNKITVAIE